MLPATLALVDDDPEYSEFLAQHLRNQGVQIQVYSDSSDLLADNEPYRFDFYVLDLMLPGMDGFSFCQKLRTEANIDKPVLMLTARDTLEDKLKGFAAGADV